MLKSVYKGGSSLFLPHPKDIDYFYYYETREECLEAIRNNRDHSIDKHFRVSGTDPKIFNGCYYYPFMQHIEGEEIPEFKTFNICDHKKEYKDYIQYSLNNWTKEYKGWYHIYIACSMFENGKNEVTEEQRQIAQQIHDNGINDDQLAFINKVLDTIN